MCFLTLQNHLDLCPNMSSSATKTDNGIELSPLRSLDDFLLESARFQVPNLKDFEKWGNRVVQNLLYYQTNYFILGLVIFTIVGVIHPTQMLVGLISFAVGVAGVVVGVVGVVGDASDAHSQITSFKQSHPLICLAIFLAAFYLLFQLVGSLLVFLLGILLPIAGNYFSFSLFYLDATFVPRRIQRQNLG
ncbi:PRA1 family protein 2-like isoform X1 [Artemia franciscana]|uniref:PRA1 family protein 2-like isoform X1 n=2 Tax=Artemia franciscana TaxID=6661 RepID=UPI0032DB7E7E